MQSVTPVLTQSEVESEQIIALDQPDFYPIVVARIQFADGQLASYARFRLTEKERALITGGADILISQPHIGRMMPIAVQIAMPECYPESE